MGSDLNNKNNSEEIDLLQLFGFFESKIRGFLKLIFNIGKLVFDVIIVFLQILQQNFVKITIAVVVSFGGGYVYDMYKPKIYSSTMMVKPMYSSKYQLYSNINYYNALIGNDATNKLSEVFGITKTEATNLGEFIMTPGPENENEKILAYDNFIKSVDTSTAKMVDYDRFIDQMSIYNSSIYELTVVSSQKDIFGKLYPGFKKTFETEYSKAEKKKKQEIRNLKKASIDSSIKSISTLKSVYLKKILEVKSQTLESIGGNSVLLKDDASETKEFEALQLEISLRKQLSDLEAKEIEEEQLFEIVSGFQGIGSINGGVLSKMKFMFPLVIFILFILGIFGLKLNKFVANYNRILR